MQKILRKRVLRDLKENFFRYLALGFLIILCMYMIGSLVGAGEKSHGRWSVYLFCAAIKR